MTVHPDIVNEKQWDSGQPKCKSCNVISLTQEDDTTTVASLSSSEEEKFALVAQPATSQPVGTWSERRYLRQYDQTPDETQQPTTLGTAALVQTLAPVAPLD